MSYFRAHVLVCAGTPCMLKGAGAVRRALPGDDAGLREEVGSWKPDAWVHAMTGR